MLTSWGGHACNRRENSANRFRRKTISRDGSCRRSAAVFSAKRPRQFPRNPIAFRCRFSRLQSSVCLQRCWRNFFAREQTRLRLFSERTVGRELLTRIQEGKQALDWRREGLQRNATGSLVNWRSRLAADVAALRRHDPSREIVLRRDRVTELVRRVSVCAPSAIQDLRRRFERLEKILTVLGPNATLQRGYSITMDASGNVIRSAANVSRGMCVRTRVSDGEFESNVF